MGLQMRKKAAMIEVNTARSNTSWKETEDLQEEKVGKEEKKSENTLLLSCVFYRARGHPILGTITDLAIAMCME